jgi:hypothetical protein
MLHTPFLLRAGVVHVYVKVFVSTLEVKRNTQGGDLVRRLRRRPFLQVPPA